MIFTKKSQIWKKKFYFITLNFFMLLLLHKPWKAVGNFRASPWYEQSCSIWNDS